MQGAERIPFSAVSAPWIRSLSMFWRKYKGIKSRDLPSLRSGDPASARRDHKGITEEDIYGAVRQAIDLGWNHIKLYFMVGLPGETDEDLDGIAEIAQNIVAIHRNSAEAAGSTSRSACPISCRKPIRLSVGGPGFAGGIRQKARLTAQKAEDKGVTFNYHDNAVSRYEAVFARGDRRCGKLLLEAYRQGCRLDGWSEHFDPEKWERAAELSGTDIDFYTTRAKL